MKRIIAIFISMIFTFSCILSGCSKASTETSKKQPEGTTSTEQNKKIEMKIAWWGSQTRNDATLKVIDLYKNKYPNVTLEAEYTSWQGYWEKLAAQSAANQLPDIIQQDYSYIKQYADRNLLISLDDYVKNKALDLSDSDESMIQSGKINSALYAISLGMNALSIVYDAEIFKKCEINEPKTGWTIDEYMDACMKIKEKLNIPGDSLFFGTYFNVYLRQFGKTMYTADGTKLGYDDDKYFVDFYDKYIKLIKAGAIVSPEQRLEIKSAEQEPVVTGKAGMYSGAWSNMVVSMSKAANKTLSMTLYPQDKSATNQGLYMKPSMFFSVSKSSKTPEDAAKFISFFTNDIEANKILFAERGVPISKKVREGLRSSLDEVQVKMFDYVELAAKKSSLIDPPEPGAHPEVLKLLSNITDQIAFGKISVNDAAKQYRAGAEKLLKK